MIYIKIINTYILYHVFYFNSGSEYGWITKTERGRKADAERKILRRAHMTEDEREEEHRKDRERSAKLRAMLSKEEVADERMGHAI